MIRIIYFGTPDFSVPFLKALLDDREIEVVAVVTQPDKPVGRKQELTAPPVKMTALEAGIPVYQFPSLRKPEAKDDLKKLDADAYVVVSYGKIIPQEILDIPRLGCVNVHPSLLPKYRGPTPYLSALLEGETKTGVTIMLLDAGMDTGPILSQTTVPILSNDTTPVLAVRLTLAGVPLLIETLKEYAAGKIEPQPQNDAQATTTKLLDREDGNIDWSEAAEWIERKIRAYTPWPGCFTVINHAGKDLRVKILSAHLENGKIAILEVQPEGKKPMPYSEFVRGYGPLSTP